MSETLPQLYERMAGCQACKLRQGCRQVIGGVGKMESPVLLIVGEAPTFDEDRAGQAFVGRAGECLREVLRATNVLNKGNTLMTHTLKCQPGEKFPTGDPATICINLWLNKEIEIARPQRMLLLGNVPLKQVANMTGISNCRGNWYNVRGIRTMATFHPKFVLRQDQNGDLHARQCFEQDIKTVADEVAAILKEPEVAFR